MFDFTFQLFDAHFQDSSSSGHALVMSGCKAIVNADQNQYSELDELNYSNINRNDFMCGYMDLELYFENIFRNPYFKFNAKCFTLRVDNLQTIKCNGFVRNDYHTKISKEGKLVIGIRYYFRSKEEADAIKECSSFLIEGFISLRKNTGVYGIMCKLCKSGDEWSIISANTYRPYKRCNIKNLVH